jgi:hypothetical protein
METEKISLNKCKTILQKDGSVYTDIEVSQIRDFLYKIANLDYEVYQKTKQKESEIKDEKRSLTSS